MSLCASHKPLAKSKVDNGSTKQTSQHVFKHYANAWFYLFRVYKEPWGHLIDFVRANNN